MKLVISGDVSVNPEPEKCGKGGKTIAKSSLIDKWLMQKNISHEMLYGVDRLKILQRSKVI